MSAIENLSYHYLLSVDQWLKNFETHWERIQAIDPVRFNEKFRRARLFYLEGAAETVESSCVPRLRSCCTRTFDSLAEDRRRQIEQMLLDNLTT